MKLWLMTRGITRDYAFLEDGPAEHWWATPLYRDATSFEHPTLILERQGGGGWRCFAGAIPSTRRDCVRTPICYSLAMSGTDADREVLLRVLGQVLHAFRTAPATSGPLTALLDDAVGDNADAWLSRTATGAQDIINGLERRFARLEACPIEGRLGVALRDMLEGKSAAPQAAAMLNFIASGQDQLVAELRAGMKSAGCGSILIMPSPVMGGQMDEFVVVTPPVVSPPPQRKAESGNRAGSGPRGMLLLVIGAVIVCMILAFVIFHNISSGGARGVTP